MQDWQYVIFSMNRRRKNRVEKWKITFLPLLLSNINNNKLPRRRRRQLISIQNERFIDFSETSIVLFQAIILLLTYIAISKSKKSNLQSASQYQAVFFQVHPKSPYIIKAKIIEKSRLEQIYYMLQSSSASSSPPSCKTYFDLVQKIGSKGRYQKRLLFLFIWALYSGGVGQLGPTFFFLMQPYSCEEQGLLTTSCTKFVCSLPSFAQGDFLSKDFSAYTIPVEYGYEYCQGSQVVNAVFGFIYFGLLVSVVLRTVAVDTFGRRPLMIFFNGVMALGSVLAVSSINIWVTGVGLFLLNCGADGAIKFSFNFLAEYYDPKLREKYSILVQVFYTVGYLLICGSSFLIKDWRITAGIFIVLPATLGFIFCLCYLREIPRYLVKQGEEKMLAVLNSIAAINGGEMLTHEDIASVASQKDESSSAPRINPLILCKYASLRRISVGYFLAVYIILTLYYGSSIMVDSFNLNPYLVGTILATADFTVYVPAFTLINSLKRKTTSIILSLTIAASAIGLIFVQKPQDCQICALAVGEIIFLFIFRFSVNFLYVLVLIYSNELFPEKVRGVSSILECVGGLSLVVNPALLGFLKKQDVNPMIYFAISAVVAFGVYGFLPETNGIVKEQIEQLQEQEPKVQELTSKEEMAKIDDDDEGSLNDN